MAQQRRSSTLEPRARVPILAQWIGLLSMVWPWTSYSASLFLTFLAYKRVNCACMQKVAVRVKCIIPSFDSRRGKSPGLWKRLRGCRCRLANAHGLPLPELAPG